MESLADPLAGGDLAELFAGAPFKTTGWAGYEKHRQHYQRCGEKREKECSPKTHATMGAAKSRKQASDDVGENGCCHDLTATNELSRVYWPSLPDQVPSLREAARRPFDERHELGRGSRCHEMLRPINVTAPRFLKPPSSLRTISED